MLAGLQAVPNQLYEAASLDRASSWMVFTRITLPFLKTPILLALLFRTIDTFKFFESPYVITQGAPGDLTESLSLMAYNVGFEQSLLGMGAAISWLMVVVINILATILIKALTRQKRRAEEVIDDPGAPIIGASGSVIS
jgi:multiple sugar transport system permease protein